MFFVISASNKTKNTCSDGFTLKRFILKFNVDVKFNQRFLVCPLEWQISIHLSPFFLESGICRNFKEIVLRIYVGNLSWTADENELRDAFAAHGEVTSVQVITDRETGRSRGFAFVEMANDAEAKEAISAVDNKEIAGRQVKVNEAKPRNEKPRY